MQKSETRQQVDLAIPPVIVDAAFWPDLRPAERILCGILAHLNAWAPIILVSLHSSSSELKNEDQDLTYHFHIPLSFLLCSALFCYALREREVVQLKNVIRPQEERHMRMVRRR
ncbi:hypothetical protein ZWY2020_043544 [Hordeum vulgare]|nr:hypothetical protein ZWY2020_043544 [Hordeum vulgare]